MSHCERLLHNYRSFARLPWSSNLAGKERVWFAVYPPSEERRLRARLPEFQVATMDAGHKWVVVDITDIVPRWLAAHEYGEDYLADPSMLATIEEDLKAHVIETVRVACRQPPVDANTVLAILGTGGLYGFIHVSAVVNGVEDSVPGRLLVFFPGEYERNLYRFMDARDGFNYMAVPITSSESAIAP